MARNTTTVGGAPRGPAARPDTDTSAAAMAAAGDAAAASGEPASGSAASGIAGDAAVAATVQDLRGEPENAVRAAEAVHGSALAAPGVGSGPAGRAGQVEAAVDAGARRAALGSAALPAGAALIDGPAGAAPGVFDAIGSHGAAFAEYAADLRRADLARDLRHAPLTGAKLAVAVPQDRAALAEYAEAGFDLIVVSRQDGFRRAGVRHPAAPTLRRSGDFAAHEIEAISRDPMLIVQAFR